MAETRAPSERYARIGQGLVASDPSFARIRASGTSIVWLASDRAKRSRGRMVFAECERVPDRNRWAIHADFCIVVYEPNCKGLDDELIERLLYHELLHVGVEVREDGTERHFLRPHDLEDFRACVERWGADWLAGAT